MNEWRGEAVREKRKNGRTTACMAARGWPHEWRQGVMKGLGGMQWRGAKVGRQERQGEGHGDERSRDGATPSP
jgi:hypothetical protein